MIAVGSALPPEANMPPPNSTFPQADRNRNQSCGHSTRKKRRARRELPNATAENVQTWLAMVLYRRSHPDPQRILDKLPWTGRDLHRATYLTTRYRLRTESDGWLIAYDISDAVKQSRRRARLRKKGLESRKATLE
ncbi:hypothetical protein F5Y00DRAFT_262688 [Daldinia vernicosa]|uniref:uncharacterized protein n=1 Tax=Daldinia vernicosa TaxID=114800 RepID=UPI00200818B2|nr:uncharacterized protein F5Y00DRAFT_262688 [Daldinia vernicosa]KAI0848304.1 hypothetical protein F5Y00DRAFT_262688 [Daldinia vernicosa]